MEQLQKRLGAYLRKVRTEAGYSQEKFALHIGMDRTYYASVEAGKRNISLQNIKKIADGFQIPVSKIFLSIEKEEE